MSRSLRLLRMLAARLCARSAMERLIEPTLADMASEHLAAVRRGRLWRARWVLVAGWVAVLKLLAFVAVQPSTPMSIARVSDDWHAVRSIVIVAAGVGLLATALLEAVVFSNLPVDPGVDVAKVIYLVPQALPIAVPAALTIGILVGVSRARLSRGVVAVVIALAIGCSAVSFAALAWLAPVGNQAFRSEFVRTVVVGHTDVNPDPITGVNEMTLWELRRRIDRIRAFDAEAPVRQLRLSYHTRWAVACSPLVLAWLALLIRQRYVYGDLLRCAVAGVLCAGFVILVTLGTQWGSRGTLSPMVAAWLPNLASVALLAALAPWRPITGDGSPRR